MNDDNYASLEMSRKLVEAGMVLDADMWWVQTGYDPIPSPCMAELWRELPDGTIAMKSRESEQTLAYFERSTAHKQANPCDALAELLIWLKKEVKLELSPAEIDYSLGTDH